MKILVLDNYDSFTWNLVDALETSLSASSSGGACMVYRSDRISLSEIQSLSPDGIVLSPGPFGPNQTGICAEVIQTFGCRIPILGVCLGMQVIAQTAGAVVRPSGRPVHGKASRIRHDGKGVLCGLPNPFLGGRYHSLIVEPSSVPPHLEISAWTEDGNIMGVRICPPGSSPIEGVMFHPESFLTQHGAQIFDNFLAAAETKTHVV